MNTRASVVLIVVVALAVYVPLGGWAVFELILAKADPGLIAVLSGMTGTALGSLSSLLTRTSASDTPVETKITNTPAEAVPTAPQS